MIRVSRKNINWLSMIALVAVGITAQGQLPGVLTNDELNLHRMFIEANREKLLGKYEDAAKLYARVLEEDPRNDAAAYELSRVYDYLERYDDALDQINTAIRIQDENPWYRLMKADILEKQENYPDAIAEYQQLTEINPKENYYFIHLADLYRTTNQMGEALQTINDLQNVAGDAPQVLEYKSELLAEMEQWEAAIVEIEKLAEFYPDNTDYLHRAASYASQAGDDELVKAYYSRILEIDPDDSRANLASAEEYRDSGEDESYLMSIAPIMANENIDLDAKISELIPYVETFVSEKDPSYEKPLGELIGILVEQYPDEAKVHAIYADFLYHSGRLDQASNEYEKTLAIDKSVYQVWEQLLQVKLEMNDPDAVLRTSENALNVFPNQGAIFYFRGLAYAIKEDFSSAEGELQQALIMSGRNASLRFDVLSLMSKVYFSTGDLKKGLEALDKALEINPNAIELKRISSALLAERATDPTALDKAAEMAKEIMGKGNNMEVYLILAKISFKQENFEAARNSMEHALDMGAGDDFLALELYGDILYSLGKVDEAVEYWTLSQSSGNQSAVLKRKIAERKIVH